MTMDKLEMGLLRMKFPRPHKRKILDPIIHPTIVHSIYANVDRGTKRFVRPE